MDEGVGGFESPKQRSSSEASRRADCGSSADLAHRVGTTVWFGRLKSAVRGRLSLGSRARTKSDHLLLQRSSVVNAVIGDEAIWKGAGRDSNSPDHHLCIACGLIIEVTHG